MKMIKYIIGVILLFAFVPAGAQDELEDYLQTAAINNPGLKARFNDYMAALEVVPQVGALPDPQLAFGYFILPVETRMGPQRLRISASQMFPWFGTLAARENSSVQLAKAKYEIFEESKSHLFKNVKETYYNLYFNKKAVDITTEGIEILNTLRNLAIVKVESGITSPIDELRVEMEIGEMENQLASLDDNHRFLTTMFNNLLNVDNNQEVSIPELIGEDDFPLSKESAMDSINGLNHQLLSLEFQQESLKFREDIASLMGKPSFKIGLDYTFIGKGDNNLGGTDAFMFPNIGITIPLYRNKYKAMVQEVVYLSAAKEEETAEKVNMLETLFEKGWKDYLDAKRRIELFVSQLQLARQSLKLLETDYSTGSTNFEEVLRMERMVLKFDLELEKARADKQAAIALINYLMGK